MNKALIYIEKGRENYSLLIPLCANFGWLASAFDIPTFRSNFFSAGAMATELIRNLPSGVNLVSDTVSLLDYEFCFLFRETTVLVFHNAKKIFDGNFLAFQNWAKNYKPKEKFVGKVVQFKYAGGSEPGAIRSIWVEKANDFTIEGFDLDKEDLRASYRKYSRCKIQGEIKILDLKKGE